MKILLIPLCLLLTVSPGLGTDEKEPTIADIMQDAHKSGLFKRLTGRGEGTAEEKKELLTYYLALQKLEPPRGDKFDWDEQTAAMVAAAQALIDDEPGAKANLKRTVNCRNCHKLYKPE